jgi:bifunctional DNA-binding transcriptional regulator/antitoxin component of YhaV-PrlF toxin-antitoxin module
MYYMTDTALITSKGTTTIPARYRKRLGLLEGSSVRFSLDAINNVITIEPVVSLEQLQKRNQAKGANITVEDINTVSNSMMAEHFAGLL